MAIRNARSKKPLGEDYSSYEDRIVKTVKRRFDAESKLSPLNSSYVWFVRAIKEKNYRKRTISKWFKRLVNKEDYSAEEITSIIHDLWLLSRAPKSLQQVGTKTAAKITSKQGESTEWYPARVGALATL